MTAGGDAPEVLVRIAAAVRRAVDAVDRPDPLVLIDGRSGAGKSTLAGLLVRPGEARLDLELVYPGWDGLHAASEVLARDVLAPRAAGRAGNWRRWDWTADAPAEVHVVAPGTPLVVEGVGSLTRETAPYADVAVWLDAPTALRRRRALDRDGEAYAPFWDRWAAQEEIHLASDDPRSLATHVFDVTGA
ncbi:nucleoside/nucleotide kinase family protein [Microbacterium sp. GXF7504]